MYSVCVGQIGLRPRDFWEMYLGEVFTAIIGFGKLQEAERIRSENIFRAIWESTRWQTASIMTALGGNVVEPKKILKLDWEEESESDEMPEIEAMSKEDLSKCANAWCIDLKKYGINVER